jgi:glucuronokinase
MLIKTHSYARAGLIGNPSDGYFGKTIAFTFSAFSAEVTMVETPELGFCQL